MTGPLHKTGKRRRDGTLSLSARWSCLLVAYSLAVSAFCPYKRFGNRYHNTPQRPAIDFQTRFPQKLFFSAELEETRPDGDSDASLPLEHVWIWHDEETWRQPDDSKGGMSVSVANTVKTLVQNWCEKFVLELDLCPWARASLQTQGAMRFFLVPPFQDTSSERLESMKTEDIDRLDDKQRQTMEDIVQSVTERFHNEILTYDSDSEEHPSSILEKAAIYFVVFLPNEKTEATNTISLLPDSFFDFIDWFTELEETWPEESDNVIVAPFHPSWEFGGTSDVLEACLDYEKRSPYPIVTLVSTDVVEKAGASVTEAIGEHNRQVLLDIEQESMQQKKKSNRNASVRELWLSAVYGKAAKKKNS